MRSEQSQWENRMRVVWLIGFLLNGSFVSGQQTRPTPQPAERVRATSDTDAVTPVEGPSTLRRLGMTIEQTSIGSASWVKGLAPSSNTAASAGPRNFTGADIFRVSCQPCHTADGSGALPEVHSLLYPVQSASVTWLTDNAKAAGRPADAAAIRRQAVEAEAALRKRLRTGGHHRRSRAARADRRPAPVSRSTRGRSRGRGAATPDRRAARPRRRTRRQGHVSHLP